MAKPSTQPIRDEGRRLRTEASEAVRKGQLRKALARYQALETLEATDAQWCCRLADIHARLGEKAEEIEVLVRAAERYAAGGFLLRGIAICKRILNVDPRHTRTQERLGSLHLASGLSPSPPPHLGAALLESGPPLAPGALAEILLDEVAEDQDAAHVGVRALPLGAEPETPAAVTSGTPRVPLFGDLGPAAFEHLIRVVRVVGLREDSILFREGDPGDALYVVVEGAVVPCAERPSRRRLAVLQEGDFFGELSLVTEQPRIATVRALVDSTLLVLDVDAVRGLIREEPGLMVVFLRFLRERLLHRLAQASPLFAGLDAAGLRRLAAQFRFLEVEDGAELVTQGVAGRRIFFSVCGRFDVTVRDGAQVRTVVTLETGDVFGERSLLSDEPAMATVTSRGRGFLLALEGSAFDALTPTQPELLEGLRALAAEDDARSGDPLSDTSCTLWRRVDLL